MTKSYRRKWLHHGCIIRQRGTAFQVEVNHGGQRKRCTLSTLAEAKTYTEQEALRIKKEGTAAFSLSLNEKIDAAKAQKSLPSGMDLATAVQNYAHEMNRLGGTALKTAVDFYLLHHKPVGGVRTVADLMVAYLASKKKENCRRRTVGDMKCRIGRLAETLGTRHVHTITSAELESWLDNNGYTGQTRINYLRVFTSFFNYARTQHLIEFNPAGMEAIKRPRLDEKLPAVFTIKDTERLLRAAAEHAGAVVPYLTIGFFAGLRTAELEGLDWADIDFAARLITVRPEIAKRRRQRHVTMSDNLLAWLTPYTQKRGKISPPSSALRHGITTILKKTSVQWIHNGMRHTFASCYLANRQDISKTALELGHTGNPTILFNHYRNLVKPADAEAYWSILPKREGKILQVPAGAFGAA